MNLVRSGLSRRIRDLPATAPIQVVVEAFGKVVGKPGPVFSSDVPKRVGDHVFDLEVAPIVPETTSADGVSDCIEVLGVPRFVVHCSCPPRGVDGQSASAAGGAAFASRHHDASTRGPTCPGTNAGARRVMEGWAASIGLTEAATNAFLCASFVTGAQSCRSPSRGPRGERRPRKGRSRPERSRRSPRSSPRSRPERPRPPGRPLRLRPQSGRSD